MNQAERATVVRLQKLDKKLAKHRRADKRRQTQAWRQELELCASRHEWAAVWRLSRKIAGTNMGPKRRRYDVVQSSRPTATAWAQHLSLPGPEGGCLACPLLYHDHSMTEKCAVETVAAPKLGHELACASPVACDVGMLDLDTVLAAQNDMDCMKFALAHGKHRRAVPAWSVPLEVWQMLFCRKFRTWGQWRQIPISEAGNVDKLMFRLLCCIRQTAAPVKPWSASQTVQLDKQNGKTGCLPVAKQQGQEQARTRVLQRHMTRLQQLRATQGLLLCQSHGFRTCLIFTSPALTTEMLFCCNSHAIVNHLPCFVNFTTASIGINQALSFQRASPCVNVMHEISFPASSSPSIHESISVPNCGINKGGMTNVGFSMEGKKHRGMISQFGIVGELKFVCTTTSQGTICHGEPLRSTKIIYTTPPIFMAPKGSPACWFMPSVHSMHVVLSEQLPKKFSFWVSASGLKGPTTAPSFSLTR